ncbi:mitogen-activated protein kinase-binding protein 1-like [Hippocampus comes]|uniref:mitogen-activated protein kinase-binding protein 1-like n=1 Tax=Hippocampus comes TaxID=109280 RepID=UPI00094EBB03|nr:PREDICTED: mitogen-activated protein kinase-binding protein 1-like [Hippocampus comes]
MSSDSDKEEEEEEEGAAEASRDSKMAPPDGRLPRRRWARNSCGGDTSDVAMVTSMLDLRQLDLYCSNGGLPTRPLDDGPSSCGPRGIWISGAGLHRADQQLGSRLSLQVEHTEALADPRPDFTSLSNPIVEREPPVLFPDQWEDRVSPSGDFEVKAASPPSGQDDKPSPDSGCSLRFNSRTSSPDRTAAKNGLSDDADSLDEDEDTGPVPQTPDQEAFLKKHFATLGDVAEGPSRTAGSSSESLSMSSRFLCQSSPASRSVPKSDGTETTSYPAVPEVRERDPSATRTSNQTGSCRPEEEEEQDVATSTERESAHRRIGGGTDGVILQRPTSLPSAPRRTAAAAQPHHNLGSAGPGSPQRAIAAATPPRKSSPPSAGPPRSYMSPTASSAAKMSRSASLGDALNRVGLTAGAASGACRSPAAAVSSFTSPGCQGNQATPLPRRLLPPDKPCVASTESAPPSGPPPPAPEPQDDADPPTRIDSCRALTTQMLSCFKRTTHLYRKVSSACSEDGDPEDRQMAALLSEALQAMRAELQSLPLGPGGGGDGGTLAGTADQERTAALLEEYSMLLLQAVHRKLGPLPPS